MKKYLAEMIGTMILVLVGCGSAVFDGAPQPFTSVGTLGIAFTFGLSMLVMCYTIGKNRVAISIRLSTEWFFLHFLYYRNL